MQIVIDIPNEKAEKLLAQMRLDKNFRDCKVIPLPKGHGRLVDEKDLSLMTVHMIDGMFVCDAPTIIEADKAESEG